MAKLLPCAPTVNPERGPCPHASIRASAAYPRGEPYIVGRYVERYKCAGCKRPSRLSVGQWNALPNLLRDDLSRLASQYGAPSLVKRWLGVADVESA